MEKINLLGRKVIEVKEGLLKHEIRSVTLEGGIQLSAENDCYAEDLDSPYINVCKIKEN